MKKIVFSAFGGDEVLTLQDISSLTPSQGEVVIEHAAIGVNYIDVYHRTGLYPVPLPSGLGLEGAGTVIECGEGVQGLAVGDRVAYATGGIGAYATHRTVAAEALVVLPDDISFETAAAVMLKGMTCEYLLTRCFPVSAGMTVLFHAIAGGVGLLACQWLKQLGVTVIGTAGSEAKLSFAQSLGCDHVINYRAQNVADEVMKITSGEGVPVVYDSVGNATFAASLDSLSTRGTLVSFGNASGPVEPFSPALLAQKGGLYVTRPSLAHYVRNRSELEASSSKLFGFLKTKPHVRINNRFGLADSGEAHRCIERRDSVGSNLILPS